MKKQPTEWLLWSVVGFGLFYAPLSFSGAYGPGWLVASTWQMTLFTTTTWIIVLQLTLPVNLISKHIYHIWREAPYLKRVTVGGGSSISQ